MKSARLKGAIGAVEKALDDLNEGLDWLAERSPEDPHRELFVDAVIKRFEILFEYCWKVLKVAAEFQGVEAPGPRPAIQEGVRFGWISDPEFWALALDARNGSVHDYFGVTRDEYLKIIRRFSTEVTTLLNTLSKM